MTPSLDFLVDELHGIWRFRWTALLIAVAVAAAGWLIIFSLPDRYEAEAKVLVDTHTALKPILQGLATNQDVNVQLNYVRQALLAGPQLRQLAQRIGMLPAADLGPAKEQDMLDGLRKRIDLSVQRTSDQDGDGGQDAGGTTYGITYQDVERARALSLVRILTSALISETLGGSAQGSQRAQRFLKAQIADYEQRLQAAEDRLAAFKSQHLGLVTTRNGGLFDQLQHETRAIDDVNTELVVAETQRQELEQQLHGDAAISATDATTVMGSNGKGGDTLSQIQQMQAHLSRLLLKYTDKYPDVIAAKQQLAELERRRAREIAALRRGDANAAAVSGASANPVYQSIQLAINKADVELAELRAELNEHRQRAQQLQQLLDKTPELEAQYAQLSRDYDINKKQYAALLASYDKARLGEQAGNAGAVRFELVQPPAVSYSPVWPPRTKLLAIVLMLALGVGGGLAYALNQLHPVVGSPTGLRQLTGIPVVAVVGCAFPTRGALAIRRQIRWFALALACLIAGFVIVVVLSHLGIRLGVMAGRPMVRA